MTHAQMGGEYLKVNEVRPSLRQAGLSFDRGQILQF
jgi:hypothetical protein